MLDIAWVGSSKDFEREFKVKVPIYIDTKNNAKYWCISDYSRARGRRFDKVITGFNVGNIDDYTAIYNEIIYTRMKHGNKEMTEQTYKLYAVKLSEINTDKLKDFEHSLIPFGRTYALVFVDKPLEKPFVEIPSETQLTEQERQFVVACKLQVNAKAMREHETEISDGLNSLLDALEKELKAEKEKGEKKNDSETNS